MKEKAKKSNYRQFYKDYYRIDFSKDMDVHHLDWNRENNNISNLLLIPKDVHNRFHLCSNLIESFFERYGNTRKLSLCDGHTYYAEIMSNYVSCIMEFEKWCGYKFLNYEFCNDSRITKK